MQLNNQNIVIISTFKIQIETLVLYGWLQLVSGVLIWDDILWAIEILSS